MITDKLLGVFVDVLGRRGWRIVEELVYVVDDVCADEDETTKVATVDTANCYWRTVHLIVWQILYTRTRRCTYKRKR